VTSTSSPSAPPEVENEAMQQETCDVLIVGGGAGGLATAVTASGLGARVILLEKSDVLGGVAAYSGGVLWIPGNKFDRSSIKSGREYLTAELGDNGFREDIDLFLKSGQEMVTFFEERTSVKFLPSDYPDYHPENRSGSLAGRALYTAAFDGAQLGSSLKLLRAPLGTITLFGMMLNSATRDLTHFYNATSSFRSFIFVAKRIARHLWELLLYRRSVSLTSGNALAARLLKSALDQGVTIRTNVSVEELLLSKGRVIGAVLGGQHSGQKIFARRGVVLACGGFPNDAKRVAQLYPHVKRGGEHLSPAPKSSTGDGIRLAESAGAAFRGIAGRPAAWMPMSRVPARGGDFAVFPHIVDRYKPGVIAVLKDGTRFVNESNSYHDFCEALIEACEGLNETAAWLICDHLTIRKYGLGYVKPRPFPLRRALTSGYLTKGRTVSELAARIGVNATGLQQTIETYNAHAVSGQDPIFGRGSSAFNRYLGDPANRPNPNVRPVSEPPFFAVKVNVGEVGTYAGLATSAYGEVLDRKGKIIDGLFAAGNDRASIMSGGYPGPGITLGPILTFAYLTGSRLARAECDRMDT
jgi:succinate dehydrogenase/fumarate reductase flavoprotein subunit